MMMMQSAGEKEMDSQNLLSLRISLSFAFVWELLKRLSLSNLSLAFVDSIDLGREREREQQRLLPDVFIFFNFPQIGM